MIKRFALICAVLTQPLCAQETEVQPEGIKVSDAPGALLRGLDKVTGMTTDFDLEKGQAVRFGRLSVALNECRYPTEDPASNAFGLITILDGSSSEPAFEGWMVAASPSLSALDHQRYDVWLIRCNIPEG